MSDELQNQETTTPDPVDADLELSHTDKLVGVFTEPGNTFAEMAKFPPKVIDWLIPVILLIVIAALSNFVLMSNPTIKYNIIQKQMEQVEKQFDEMVKSGQMTQEQADTQLERTREFMENQAGAGMIFQVVGIIVVIFIVFFVVSGVFFLVIKFGLKGEGTYSSAMVGYGLPFYISIVQLILIVIISWVMDRYLTGTSVAAFLDMDVQASFAAMLLSKVDPFSIWFYAVISIGFAKMFKSISTAKYMLTVFGMWIGFSIVLYFLAQAVPFLKWFVR